MASSRKRPVKKATKRAARPRSASENEIHMKCQQWLGKASLSSPLLIFHVPNERKASVQYHLKLKRLGVLPGVADYLAFPMNGRKVAIEFSYENRDNGTTDSLTNVGISATW